MARMKVFVSLCVLALVSGGVLWGQTPSATATPTPVQDIPGFWQAVLPGGNYIVRLSAISSVSQHEYLVDGGLKVTEVNIETIGSALARFYFVEPAIPQTPNGIGQGVLNTVTDRAKELVGRTGINTTSVTKSYPTTTHAHTIEYRLDSLDAVTKLFTNAQRAFTTGNGTVFRPQ